mgnify:CR=1 FL=1
MHKRESLLDIARLRKAALDQQQAAAAVGGDEFIFDVQTHCVDPAGSWNRGADGAR